MGTVTPLALEFCPAVFAQPTLCTVQTPSGSAQSLGELSTKTPVLSVGIMRSQGRSLDAWAFA